MRKTIFVIILITQQFLLSAQDTIFNSYSTKEILNYCIQNGGDSTLKKYDCSYLGFIDSAACMQIFNSIKNSYSKLPNETTNINSYIRFLPLYLPLYYVYNRNKFIYNTGTKIKNQRILNILKANQFAQIECDENQRIKEINDYELLPIRFQIQNSRDDSLLLYFADLWKNKSKEFCNKKFSPFKINISVIFTGDYPKVVRNCVNCKENEIVFLNAYNRINSGDKDKINLRIADIGKELYNKTQFEGYLDNYDYSYFDNKPNRTKIYQLHQTIKNLDELNLKEFIKDIETDRFTSLSVLLIHNGDKGILYSDLDYTVNHRGYAHSISYYVKLLNDNNIELQIIDGEYINQSKYDNQ